MGGSESKELPVAVEAFEEYLPEPASLSLVESLFPEDPTEVIYLSGSGFSKTELSLFEDDVIEFQWVCLSEPGYSVYQAVSDGSHLRPVPGGFASGPPQMSGKWRQRLRHAATYWFIATGIKTSPMSITVLPKDATKVLVNDTGFHPETVAICKGRNVQWHWKDPLIQHSVHQVEHCARHNGFTKTDVGSKLATLTGSFTRQFLEPGLYYFQSGGADQTGPHLCVVHVLDIPNEHAVEVLSKSFSPMLLTIEQFDRVWWHWDSADTEVAHSVFQVHGPEVEDSAEEPLRPVEDGFKWPSPSVTGLVSHAFELPGVFFCADQSYDAVASYVAVVVVLPSPKKHYFELTREQGIKPNLVCIERGDRLWWVWNSREISIKQQPFVMEVERCIGGGEGTTLTYNHCRDRCNLLTERELDVIATVGLQMTMPVETGVYQFRLSNCGVTQECCSVVVVPGSRNVFVTVADDGYNPRVVSIMKGDTVWWTWHDTQAAHNILQVDQTGERIAGGFCSGGMLESPAAACHQFNHPGIFYYCSQSLPILYGVVQVYSQPVISPVYVTEIGLEPTLTRIGDVVTWVFQKPSCFDVEVFDPMAEDLVVSQVQDEKCICPRRAVARQIATSGVFHFTSPHFGANEEKQPHQLQRQERKVSSIIVDGISDAVDIFVSNSGFVPSRVTVYKDTSVCWSWKRSSEQHNIVRVKSPLSDSPLDAIRGIDGFSSGEVVAEGQFLFTFSMAGEYWVASEGSPGHACCVTVLGHPLMCERPFITSANVGGVVGYGECVRLGTANEEEIIYFTSDGTSPAFGNQSCLKYNRNLGIRLEQPGFAFIRAFCFNERCINSFEMVSPRFEVQRKLESPTGERIAKTMQDVSDEDTLIATRRSLDWLLCVPKIECYFSVPGTLVVKWAEPEHPRLISGFQVFLNSISYCPVISGGCRSVVCSGLAGGTPYSVKILSFSSHPCCFPLESNCVTVVCPDATAKGGPVISLRTCRQMDAVICVWQHLPTDAMSYLVCLNGIPVGDPVVPAKGLRECQITLNNLSLNCLYKLFVTPISHSGCAMNSSNKIAFKLPLNTHHITYPEMRVSASLSKKQLTEFIWVLPDDGEQKTQQTIQQQKIQDYIAKYAIKAHIVKSVAVRRIEMKRYPADRCLEKNISDTSGSESDDDISKRQRFLRKRPVFSGRAFRANKQSFSRQMSEDEGRRPHGKDRRSPPGHHAVPQLVREDTPVYRGNNLETVPIDSRSTSSSSRLTLGSGDFYDEYGVYQGGASSEPYSDIISEGHLSIARGPTPAEDYAAPQAPVDDKDSYESVVCIEVENGPNQDTIAAWYIKDEWKSAVEKDAFILRVAGAMFNRADTPPNLTYETQLTRWGTIVDGVEYCYHLDKNCSRFSLANLLVSQTYDFSVTLVCKNERGDTEHKRSKTVQFTTWGPPQPPVLKCVSVGEREVMVAWEPRDTNKDIRVTSFALHVEPQGFTKSFQESDRNAVLSNLYPGVEYHVTCVAVTDRVDVSNSEVSNRVTIFCPAVPHAPEYVNVSPSSDSCKVRVYWPSCRTGTREYDVISYLAFLDGQLYDDVPAVASQSFCSCDIDDLEPGEVYEVAIICRVGWSEVSPLAVTRRVVCQVLSDFSVVIPIMCSSPPLPFQPEPVNINESELRVCWQPAVEFGAASVSGYEVHVDGSPYGDILPPDMFEVALQGLTYGLEYAISVKALTEHSVGRVNDAGLYSACITSSALVIKYGNFALPACGIFEKQRTGQSLSVGWHLDVIRSSFTCAPDCLMAVIHRAENSDVATRTFCLSPDVTEITFDGLQEAAEYEVIIQSRKLLHLPTGDTVVYTNSTPICLSTLSPPKGPKNITVIDASTTALKLAWNNQPDPFNQIERLRVEYAPHSHDTVLPLARELPANAECVVLRNLFEGTEYHICVIGVTAAYRAKQAKQLRTSRRGIEDSNASVWIPTARTVAVTSGCHGASEITIIDRGHDFIHISWTPPVVVGANTVSGQILRWVEWNLVGAISKTQFSHKRQVDAGSSSYLLDKLQAGLSYRVTVDACVRAKLHLSEDNSPSGPFVDLTLSSEPLIARTVPQLEQFQLVISKISSTEFKLSWTTPVLWSISRPSAGDGDTKYQLWELVDYTVRCNGTNVKHVGQASSCAIDAKILRGQSLCVCAQLRQLFPERKMSEEILETVTSNSVKLPACCDFDEISVVVEKTPGSNLHNARLSWFIDTLPVTVSHHVVTVEYSDGTSVLERKEIRVKAEGRGAVIDLTLTRCIVTFSVTAIRSGQRNLVSASVSSLISGDLQPPVLWLYRQSLTSFTICWGERQAFTTSIAGYRVYVNDKELQPQVSAEQRWLAIPCKPNMTYRVMIQAISGDTRYASSEFSPELEVFSGSVIDTFFASAAASPSARESFIQLKAEEQSGKSITVTWPKLPVAIRRELLEYRLVWSSGADPQKHEVPLKITRSKYRLHKLVPGEMYHFKLYLFSRDNRIIHQSQEVDVEVSAPPDAPVLHLKSSNLKCVCVQWGKAREYGSNHVTGYAVVIDGGVAANVPSCSTEYVAANGKSCQQYVFQVGAQGVTTTYSEALSEPLIVTWPGVVPPQVRHVPTNKATEIHVCWDQPSISGGLQVASYRVYCSENAEALHNTVFKTVLGPLHSFTTEAVFEGLPQCLSGFRIQLEIECHGVSETFMSEAITVLPGVAPPAPILTVSTLGASQRASLDQAIVRLCQRRDRLLQSIHIETHECKFGMCDLSTNFEMYQLADTLYRIEQLLAEALKQVEDYTGAINLGLSWHVEESGREPVPIARYRLFVDGNQYGSDISSDVHHTTISLGLGVDHAITIRSVREKPELMSVPSNAVSVTGDNFLPFTYFCLHHVHLPGKHFPESGCCSYQETFNQEIHTNTGTALSPGPLHSQRFFPSLTATLVGDGSAVPIVNLSFEAYSTLAAAPAVRQRYDSRDRCRKPRLILIWTPWCKASQRAIKHLTACAERGKADVSYVTCSFDPTIDGPGDWQEISNLLADMHLNKCQSIVHTVVSKDVCDVLAVFGVPTFLFVHPNNTLAYQGRIPVQRTADLENTILHMTSRIKRIPCQVQSCPMCEPLLTSVASVDADSRNHNTVGFFPAINRPLEVSPAYPPLNVNPFGYDPFLSRWRQYNPYHQLPSRRVPWAFYAGDYPALPAPATEVKKKRDDFKELPPIQRSPNSSGPSRTSSSARCPSSSAVRVPWFRPRKSVLMQQYSPAMSPGSSQWTSGGSGSLPSGSFASFNIADSPLPVTASKQ